MYPEDMLDKSVLSGLGEEIGKVVGVVRSHDGRVAALNVREAGEEPRVRVIETEHVMTVDGEQVRLKGPRQGYHIARLGSDR